MNLEYRGFEGSVNYEWGSTVFYHGKILGIEGLVLYQSSTRLGLEDAFEEAVEDYLTFCEDTPEGTPEISDKARLEAAVAVAYVALGAAGAPDRVLDYFSEVLDGGNPENPLPVFCEEFYVEDYVLDKLIKERKV